MTAILVTRPAGGRDPLVALLEGRGYRAHAVPTVATEPVGFDASRLAGCDWIVVTSARGVESMQGVAANARFAAVGEKTAAALRARGIHPAHVPDRADDVALAESMPDMAGKKVGLVRASAGGDELPALLRRRGAIVEEITAYRTVEGPEPSRSRLHAALADPSLVAIVFASGSAVRGFIGLGGDTRLPAVTIGPRTSTVAREQGFLVAAEAASTTAESLADAVAGAFPVEGDHHA